jgi:hypothetical protein
MFGIGGGGIGNCFTGTCGPDVEVGLVCGANCPPMSGRGAFGTGGNPGEPYPPIGGCPVDIDAAFTLGDPCACVMLSSRAIRSGGS